MMPLRSDRRSQRCMLWLALWLVLGVVPGPAQAETRTECIDKVCLHVSRSFDRGSADRLVLVPRGPFNDRKRVLGAQALERRNRGHAYGRMLVPDRALERGYGLAGRLQLAKRQCRLRANAKRIRIAEQAQ